MDILFQGTVAKFVDHSEDNEDALLVDRERGRIVVCDGASESFDAKNWAHLLVDSFSKCDLIQSVVQVCQAEFKAIHNPAEMSWSKAAAYERGSFSTLLIAQENPEAQCVHITCLGDSFAVLTDGERLLGSLPYQSADGFNTRPFLLSTVEQHNTQLWVDNNPLVSAAQWSYEGKKLYLLCMTDALGAWLLSCIEKGNHEALKYLVGIRSITELIDLVEDERGQRTMRRDDSTLVIALLQGDS
ncbi:hypothetical protein ACFOJE_21040 [Azotobacter bryophylli]|uniref:Protein phosphatase 2C domain-containing protein n=1 Tax=Azotobacter bryophylli TaxID=1986537 RepID=A0ABV7B1R8_9GAMM